MNKKEILKSNYDARVIEVMEYQINIDNYKLALQEIERRNDPDLDSFKKQVQSLLASSIVEQKKAQVMLDVLSSQLE